MENATKGHQNPFNMFPLEIWTMILDDLTDLADIENVLQVFPQLSKLFYFPLRIGEIMPLVLLKYLTFKDILSCRLVSKRWKTAVGLAIDENPDLRPYDPRSLEEKREHVRARALSYFNRNPTLETICDSWRLSELETVERTSSSSLEMDDDSSSSSSEIEEIEEDSSSSSSSSKMEGDDLSAFGENPLVSRSVSIGILINHNRRSAPMPPPRVGDLIPWLEKIGHHIWHFAIHILGSPRCELKEFQQQFLQPFYDCLWLLPNLKSVSLSGAVSIISPSKSDSPYSLQFIRRPGLISARVETISIEDLRIKNFKKSLHSQLVKTFVNHAQVKKLEIYLDSWSRKYRDMFPNLVELHLNAYKTQDACQKIQNVLKQLRSPGLRKLKVQIDELSINGFIRILVPYQIESLEILSDEISEENEENVSTVSSVKEMRIHIDDATKWKFLRCLPSLQYLIVVFDDWAYYEEVSEEEMSGFGRSLVRYWKDKQNDPGNFESVWLELPNLDMLTVEMPNDDTRMYLRECRSYVYVHSKLSANESSSDNE